MLPGALLLLLLGPLPAPGQPAPGPNRRLDSVAAVLRRHPVRDTTYVKLLNELMWENRASNPARAFQLGAEALGLARAQGFRRGQAKTYALRGILHCYAGRLDSGRVDFQRALRLRRQLGDSVGVAGMLSNIGETYASQGHYEAAVRAYLRGEAMQERYGTPGAAALDLTNLGLVLLAMERPRAAITYFQRFLALKKRILYPPNEAEIRRNLAGAYLSLHQPDSARRYAAAAYRLSASCGDQRGAGLAQTLLARAALATGQLAAGTAYARQALRTARALAEKPALLQALLVAGQFQQQRGQLPAARASLLEAQRLAVATTDLAARQQAAQLLAGLEKQAGRPAAALAWQEQAAQLQDSLLSKETAHQVAEMQIRYETERQQTQGRLQAARLRTQQQVIRRRNAQLLAAGALALLGLGGGYLHLTRRRLQREVEFAHERQQLTQARAAAVLAAEEAERRRIGLDLHDGVGQLLVAARLNLSSLGQQLGALPTGQQVLLDNAQELVEDSFKEVRSISHNLVPNALLKQGLTRAVREFLQKSAPDGTLHVALDVVGLDENGRLDPTVENVLFRVIQEAVQNVVKHARATRVTIQIIRSATDLTVVIEDNGVGFELAALVAGPGIGLRNIETRLAYLGGRADFDTTPGRGTTVVLEVPLATAA